MNKEGFAIRQMEDRVRKAGADGLPLSELTRAFQHDNRPLRVQRLQTLLASETVLAFLRQTAGRAAIILVHNSATHDHKLRHPDDKQRFDI
jgi:hypothetical protein